MHRQDDHSQIHFDLGGEPAMKRGKRFGRIGPADPADGPLTAGAALRRIRAESRDESEKGRWFEQLVMRLALQEPEFEIADIQRWPDWPDRERLTGRDGRDIGIDLVAKRRDGGLVAVQCKCYDDGHMLGKRDIDSFLAESQRGNDRGPVFVHRWIVSTCRWGGNAQEAIESLHPGVSHIDFRAYLDRPILEEDAARPVRPLLPRQTDAVDDVVFGLGNHDRGRLVMACGTGKTFTSLRIAERIVPEDGRILFAAPTIALVSQARREWLRHTTRPLDSLVVCSDRSAGGRGEDIRRSELECPVSTDPARIADFLDRPGNTRAVFATYHSLRRVTEAQGRHGAPAFDLAVADEAHRTTGVDRSSLNDVKVDFQEFHDDARLLAGKRLYMTATPRIYTERSKRALKTRGIDVIDMTDTRVYGPELHRLSFRDAVKDEMLSDYRVIVLGMRPGAVTPAMRGRLEKLPEADGWHKPPKVDEMIRVLGVSLAVNGLTEADETDDAPGTLPRTIAFANTIARSKWYAAALMDSKVLDITTRRLEGDQRAMKLEAVHLDASSSAGDRNIELRELAAAGETRGECRVISNCRLFSEGVDVPNLTSVAFLDARDSQVDVVQAVGRVMRKVPGKKYGYIIVPVVVPTGRDVVDALETGSDGYRTVGRVLRALQAHDGRLVENLESFIRVFDGKKRTAPPPDRDGKDDALQRTLDFERVKGDGIYARVAAASGLGRAGQLEAEEIAGVVKRVGTLLEEEHLEKPIADALDLVPDDAGGVKGICRIGTLILANACLLERRLRDVPKVRLMIGPDRVGGAASPRNRLRETWRRILKHDYKPIFRPALAVLKAIGDGAAAEAAVSELHEAAGRLAQSLGTLGYDYAGPLYHRILGTAKSDGAFYTNNLSAVMLARLALTDDFTDWSDLDEVRGIRIMDPACGTGTLLMAALQAIKAQAARAGAAAQDDPDLHRDIVENVLCGLDINAHAVQLAACNLTLGAPTVDYRRMNLGTMPHGPQADGDVRAGSLELLTAADKPDSLHGLLNPGRAIDELDAEHVDADERIEFQPKDLDLVIMNPPFTDNQKRARKFGAATTKRMQAREAAIQAETARRDPTAGGVITANSISTFFTPLAEHALDHETAVLAKVLPVTACTSAGGLAERRFLAERFHIERIVTSHDPKRPNFSENTGIHEALLIARRRGEGSEKPTEFVSLARMPGTNAEPRAAIAETLEAVDAILSGRHDEWGSVCRWPADRVRAGDWTPAQWYDGTLAEMAREIEENAGLEPVGQRFRLGPEGRGIQGAYDRVGNNGPGAVPGFHSVSSKLRRTLQGEPDVMYAPKAGKTALAAKYAAQRSRLLVAMKMNTMSGRLSGLWTETPSFGWWVPVSVNDKDTAKALAAWWNSTPARLMLLNRRARTLIYPMWQVAHLREIRIPKPENPAWTNLREAFEHVKKIELLPMGRAAECPARRVIDRATAKALGVSEDVIADWRRPRRQRAHGEQQVRAHGTPIAPSRVTTSPHSGEGRPEDQAARRAGAQRATRHRLPARTRRRDPPTASQQARESPECCQADSESGSRPPLSASTAPPCQPTRGRPCWPHSRPPSEPPRIRSDHRPEVRPADPPRRSSSTGPTTRRSNHTRFRSGNHSPPSEEP